MENRQRTWGITWGENEKVEKVEFLGWSNGDEGDGTVAHGNGM